MCWWFFRLLGRARSLARGTGSPVAATFSHMQPVTAYFHVPNESYFGFPCNLGTHRQESEVGDGGGGGVEASNVINVPKCNKGSKYNMDWVLNVISRWSQM